MTDLTQFYGEQGLVIDKNFAFTSTSKSNGDLISEMRSNGLLRRGAATVSCHVC